MNGPRFFFIFGLVITAMLSRLLPHPPNFTALNAVALFSAYALTSRWAALSTLYSALFLTDLLLGFHSQMALVYLSLGMVIWMRDSRLPWFVSSALSPLLFFVVVNGGVWLVDGMYPMTAAGCAACYIAALPFLGNQLIGDMLYSSLLFGLLFLGEKWIPSLRKEFAEVELSW
jgi:hypothetical protein